MIRLRTTDHRLRFVERGIGPVGRTGLILFPGQVTYLLGLLVISVALHDCKFLNPPCEAKSCSVACIVFSFAVGTHRSRRRSTSPETSSGCKHSGGRAYASYSPPLERQCFGFCCTGFRIFRVFLRLAVQELYAVSLDAVLAALLPFLVRPLVQL